MIKALGIAGVAKCGKDALFNALAVINPAFTRFSLTDPLKKELKVTIFDLYGIDIFKCTHEEHEQCRKTITDYKNFQRNVTEGNYQIDILSPEIKTAIEKNLIPVVVDIAYPNEARWIRDMGGFIIHLKKYVVRNGKRVYTPPINDTEAYNDPIIADNVNLNLEWEDGLSPEKIAAVAKDTYNLF